MLFSSITVTIMINPEVQATVLGPYEALNISIEQRNNEL